MVYDNLSNAQCYFGLGTRIKQGLEYLSTTDFNKVLDGKYELDGEDLYVMISSYETKPLEQAKLESHFLYIDIFYVIDGIEDVHCGFVPDMQRCINKPADKDVAFYEGIVTPYTLKDDKFLILYPQDVHAPGLCHGEISRVRKIVIKARIS